MRNAIFWIAAAIAAVSTSGCATAPEMDGGIVGTGNRPDCEAMARKDPSSLPPECRR